MSRAARTYRKWTPPMLRKAPAHIGQVGQGRLHGPLSPAVSLGPDFYFNDSRSSWRVPRLLGNARFALYVGRKPSLKFNYASAGDSTSRRGVGRNTADPKEGAVLSNPSEERLKGPLSTEDATALQKLLTTLKNGHTSQAVGAVQTLMQKNYGSHAVEGLIEALSRTIGIQKAAAKALGDIKDLRAIEPLIQVLENGHWENRPTVERALVNIGEPVVQPLIEKLLNEWEKWRSEGPDPNHQRDFFLGQIADVLAKTGDVRAVEPILQTCADAGKGGKNRAYWTLKKMGQPAIDPLFRALEHENPSIRDLARDVLAKLDPSFLEGRLIKTLKEGGSSTQAKAAAELEKIGDPGAIGLLIEKLKGGDPSVREAAVDALIEIADASAIDLLDETLEHDDSAVRCAVLDVLKIVGRNARIDHKPIPNFPAFKNAVMRAAKDRDPEIRRRAISLLEGIVTPEVDAILINALQDHEAKVRRRAAVALKYAQDPRACGSLVTALNDNNPDVREAAMDTLTERGDLQAVPSIIEVFEREQGDAGCRAARDLGLLGDHRAVEPLVATILDKKKGAVRQAAAEALSGIDRSRAHLLFKKAVEDGDSALESLIGEAILQQYNLRQHNIEAILDVIMERLLDTEGEPSPFEVSVLGYRDADSAIVAYLRKTPGLVKPRKDRIEELARRHELVWTLEELRR
ncbi:MAG TPA: hypothetical protein DF383_09165, partial [Deltaproteobacteria bacterium]|nr:hypothetical protein [Deltaproteobacteria bacterium]